MGHVLYSQERKGMLCMGFILIRLLCPPDVPDTNDLFAAARDDSAPSTSVPPVAASAEVHGITVVTLTGVAGVAAASAVVAIAAVAALASVAVLPICTVAAVAKMAAGAIVAIVATVPAVATGTTMLATAVAALTTVSAPPWRP